jgi:UDP-N-acetyl-D-mannosaminuronic acid dehydrogenase
MDVLDAYDICIIGLGYIGLPTAAMFASHGKRVLGVDINRHVVETVNRGAIHIEEPGLERLVKETVAAGNLVAATTVQPANAYIIAVPTPIRPDHTADMGAVRSAAQMLAPQLQPGALVVLESTSPPGATADLVRPILESYGLAAGIDFGLAYSPERVLPGKIIGELVNNDRVVGGINRASAEAVRDLYSVFVRGEIMLTDATTAEMVKLMENTFRDVNIALANEFALVAEQVGISVWEAIALANHHPRVNILRPGPGVGGHCIAVDPWFLVEAAPLQARLIHQARRINDEMPEHILDLVRANVAEGATIACLGLTFKADVDDVRESPAMEIAHRLRDAGYRVRAHDPYVRANGDLIVSTLEAAVQNADLAVVLVDHAEFRALAPVQLATMRQALILDTRNCLSPSLWNESGFAVTTLGATQQQATLSALSALTHAVTSASTALQAA